MSEHPRYLSVEEVSSLQHLHNRAPYAITGISHGIFSLARHYGGITYDGCSYSYIPEHDECIRNDVLALVLKKRNLAAKQKRTEEKERAKHAQMSIEL